MKKWLLFIVVMLIGIGSEAYAQCSICTKTAQQMGEKPAQALNLGIIYLAAMPIMIFTYIGYRWWKQNRSE
ncbi:MAG: hypothetical protein H7Y27_14755 [Gemmatimonadaceae bacterium]|nr:hypothetical protein [Chitinophagaceae bacterium]